MRFIFVLALILLSYCESVKEDCSVGWYSFGDSCYYFSDNTKKWSEASRVCKSKKGYLARIESRIENEYLKSLSRLKSGGLPVWVDLTDENTEGTWRFSTSNKPLKFTDWNINQPDSSKNENCGGLWKDFDFKWDANPCNTVRRYICEKDRDSSVAKDECSRTQFLLDELVACKKRNNCH